MITKRSAFKVVIIASISFLMIYGLWPEPQMVDAIKVKSGPLTVYVEEEGKTRVIDRFIISAPVSAHAKRLTFKVGHEVAKDQIIVEFEPTRSTILDPRSQLEAEARVEAALSTFNAAEQNVTAIKADLDYAKAEYERRKKLIDSKSISQRELDLALFTLRKLEAQYRSDSFSVDVAQFKLKEAQRAIEYSIDSNKAGLLQSFVVKSPVHGKVLKIINESEGVVTLGQPLIEIGDPQALEVVVDVLSNDAVKILPGNKVIFERWGGDFPLEGTVKSVEPTGFTKVSALGVEEQRVWVISTITTPYEKWKRLGDGYRVEASFIIWSADKIISVPTGSLFRKNSHWCVFKIVNMKAQLTPVEIGHSNGLYTQITKGLSEGDIVITNPDSNISNGTRVKVKENIQF